MRVLQVGSYLAPDLVGGAEISALGISEALTRDGHNVYSLFYKHGGEALKVHISSSEIGWVAETWRPYAPISPGKTSEKPLFYALEYFSKVDDLSLRAMASAISPDVILIHSFRGMGYDILRALGSLGVPIACVLHDYALVCINKGMRRGEHNCPSQCGRCKPVSAKASHALNFAPRVALIGPSQFSVSKVAKYLGLKNASLLHIPNPNRYEAVARVRSKPAGAIKFGYVGRLEPDKGVMPLIEVVKRISRSMDVKLIIAGDGSLGRKVSEETLENPWLDYRGQIPREEVGDLLDELDCLVLPSLWPENFPGVAVHASLAGLPVVAFDVGGVGEIVSDGHSGRLVPPEDFTSLERELIELAQDADRITAYSNGALARAFMFDPTQLAAQYVDAIKTLARTGNSSPGDRLPRATL